MKKWFKKGVCVCVWGGGGGGGGGNKACADFSVRESLIAEKP